MTDLRDDQQAALDALRDSVGGGTRRIMMQAATGWGKTVLSGAVVKRALAKNHKVLFTVPAISLIDQTIDSLGSQGIYDIGVMQAMHPMTDWRQPVQVASVQTLMKRKIPDASVVLIDEAHKWFAFYEGWLLNPEWRNRPFIGLSATPWTRGLGRYYEKLIIAGTTAQCIQDGILSPFKVFAPSHPDLKGVDTVAGDYHEGQLSGVMSKPGLVADVIETWQKRGEGRPTLCFAVDRAHAKHLQQKFTEAGISCAYQDAYTKSDERRMIKMRFHSGEYKIVCNVGTLTVGIDWDVRCLILARPTKSEILFVQIIGRGLRTAQGKDHCLILDHSDNHLRLGFVTDIHHDELDDGKARVSNKTNGVRLPKECPQCAYLKAPGTALCPNCGFLAKKHSNIPQADGELQEIKPGAAAKEVGLKHEDKGTVYAGLLWIVHERGYKEGWAANQFKELFGVWPNYYRDVTPEQPSAMLRSWIKHRQIRWAKRRDHTTHSGFGIG